jgi:ribonucleoside-triphosphate reductase
MYGEVPYYTNSSHLPVGFTEDVFTALDIQDELQTLYTSGTVFHAFLGEKLPTWQSAAALVRKIAENYRLPYYTISPTYSVCREHGYISGEHFKCPKCGKDAEVYSRITGYYRPVQNWNAGKTKEYQDRKVYDVASSMTKHSFGTHKADACACGEEKTAAPDGITLFATAACPKCRVVMTMLENRNLPYTKKLVEENEDEARALGLRQAPTLIVTKNGESVKYETMTDIREYLNNL